MRRVRGGVGFAGMIGAMGVGAYLGAALAGLLAVLTGQAFAEGSPWPGGAVALAVLGAVAGGLVAGLTALAWTLRRRPLLLVLGGLVSLPLATAIGQLDQVDSVGVGLVAAGGVVGMLVHITSRLRRPTGQVVDPSLSARG